MTEQPTVHVVVWSNDHDADVSVLADVSGFHPEPELTHDDLRLTPVGRFLVASGHTEARRRYQDWTAAIIVQDIADTVRRLTSDGAELIAPVHDGQTGRFCFARLPGGQVHEYVQRW